MNKIPLQGPEKTSYLSDIIGEINNSIFNGELTEIIEVTYSYDDFGDHVWNTTLFGDFGECTMKDNLSFIEEKVSQKLKEKIVNIDYFLEKLSLYEEKEEGYDETELSNNPNHIRHGLLKESLVFSKRCLEMSYIGLPFEIEKAGGSLDLSAEEIQKRISQLEDLEKINFGGNIKDNTSEVELCYTYLYELYKAKKHKLSHKGKVRFKKYIQEIEKFLPEGFDISGYKKSNINQQKESYFSDEMKEILERKISRKDYAQYFGTILNSFLHLDFDIKIEDKWSTIYDGEGEICIPGNEKYAYKTLRNILQWFTHELEAHSMNLRTTQKVLGKFRGAGSVEKEEAIAMMSQELLMGTQLEDIGITSHFPKVLMAEILGTDELYEFLKYLDTLSPDVTTRKKRLLRLKRNYPLGYKGGQHKDTSYTRGILKLKQFLLQGGDIRDYYVGKVAAEDLPKLKRLIELEGTQKEVHTPLMIAELFLYYLFPKNQRPAGDFLTYLKEKYPFINFEDQEIELFELSQKKQIIDILWNLQGIYPERNINTQENLGVDTTRLFKT